MTKLETVFTAADYRQFCVQLCIGWCLFFMATFRERSPQQLLLKLMHHLLGWAAWRCLGKGISKFGTSYFPLKGIMIICHHHHLSAPLKRKLIYCLFPDRILALCMCACVLTLWLKRPSQCIPSPSMKCPLNFAPPESCPTLSVPGSSVSVSCLAG